MKQLIYRSLPVAAGDNNLGEILLTAWSNNRRDQISGALICREGLYLQLIEGPDDLIDALYANIVADERHTDVQTLVETQVSERILSAWSMLDERTVGAGSEVSVETVNRATPAQLRAVFQRIAVAARELPEDAQ